MNTPFTLLGLLAKQENYGYDLKQEYDRLFSTKKQLPFGQVYSTLARLNRDNLIKVADEESSLGPDRKKYQITKDGNQTLKNWFNTPEEPQPKLQVELFIKIVLMIILNQDVEKYLDVQKKAHLEKMREITKGRKSKDISYMLLSDHAIFHIEADIRWIDLTSARLNTLRKELV